MSPTALAAIAKRHGVTVSEVRELPRGQGTSPQRGAAVQAARLELLTQHCAQGGTTAELCAELGWSKTKVSRLRPRLAPRVGCATPPPAPSSAPRRSLPFLSGHMEYGIGRKAGDGRPGSLLECGSYGACLDAAASVYGPSVDAHCAPKCRWYQPAPKLRVEDYVSRDGERGAA